MERVPMAGTRAAISLALTALTAAILLMTYGNYVGDQERVLQP